MRSPDGEGGSQHAVCYRLDRAGSRAQLHNQPYCHRLHSARRKSATHLVPQQRRYLIAHKPIEHAPCLLRIHKILIHIASVIESFLHRLLRDLVKGDAANLFPLFGRGSQLQSQVIRNRFTFAVRVRVRFRPHAAAALFSCATTFSLPGDTVSVGCDIALLATPRLCRSWAGP